jgi:hypothetical protein
MDYEKLLPEAPADMAQWLHKIHKRGREALVYKIVRQRSEITKKMESLAECKCTYCGASWLAALRPNGSYPQVETQNGFISNGNVTKCPECGKNIEAAFSYRLHRHHIKSTVYPWTITKADGCLIFTCWAAIHEITRDSDWMEIRKRNAYIVTPEGKWVRYTAMERSGWSSLSPMEYIGEWYETQKMSFSDYAAEPCYPHTADVYEGTALENAKLEIVEEKRLTACLAQYAKLYLKHPQVENLVMTCPNITKWIIKEYMNAGVNQYGGKLSSTNWINWEAAKPHEMLGVEKARLKKIEETNTVLNNNDMRLIRAEIICKKNNISTALAPAVDSLGYERVQQELSKYWVTKKFGLAAVLRYIAKNERKTQYRMSEVLRDCKDYWDDLHALEGADIDNPAVIFAGNLEESHARIIVAKKYAEQKVLREKFSKKAEMLEPLAWEYKGLLIRAAKSEKELIKEGKTLKHCVGGYGEEHCAGNCIFFIRNANTPDKSFFTLQLDTKTGRVIQNRGLKNCGRTKEVQEFETEWLKQVVQPWIKSKSKKKQSTKTKAA